MSERERKQIRFEVQTASPGHEARAIRGEQSNTPESMNLARAQGLNLEAFAKVLEACPMASNYSKIKVKKMLDEDWSAQATIKDCHNSTELIQSAAASVDTKAPFIQLCGALYGEAKALGLGEEDMIAVTKMMMKP